MSPSNKKLKLGDAAPAPQDLPESTCHNAAPPREESRRWLRQTRIHVALLGLAIAAVNCYAQATFCMAIVEMVVPSDAERAPPAAPHLNQQRPLAAADLSCPIEFRYRHYYDTRRFDNNSQHLRAPPTTDAPITSPIAGPFAAGAPVAATTTMIAATRFNWDSGQQGVLLGAFAFGMAPLQVFAGRLAEIYGSKWVLFGACLGTALTNLTIAPLAELSFLLLVLNRVLMGVSQAGMEPGLMCLLADWLTPSETGFFISMLLFAMCIGFFFGSLLSGYILAQQTFGWPLTFYVSGGLNLVVALVWLVYADSWPSKSRFASREEVAHIVGEQEKLRKQAKQNSQLKHKPEDLEESGPKVAEEDTSANANDDSRKSRRAPWRNILTTRSVWAFIICKFSIRWCADVTSIELPTYLANVLHVSIKINGILNSISSALFAIFSFLAGWLVNELANRSTAEAAKTSKTTLRVVTQSIASFGSALTLFLMTTYDCNIVFSMSMLLVFSCLVVLGTGGEFQIPYDMTQKYPGTLHGMACALSVSGWLAPPLIGKILDDQPTSRARWNTVWYLTASIAVFGGLVFLLFADANPRDFDTAKEAPRRVSPAPGKKKRRPPAAAGGYDNAACKQHDNSTPPLAKRLQPAPQNQTANSIYFDTKLISIRQLDESILVLPTSCCPSNLDRPPKELVFPYRDKPVELLADKQNLEPQQSRPAKFLVEIWRSISNGPKGKSRGDSKLAEGANNSAEASAQHSRRLEGQLCEQNATFAANKHDEPLRSMTHL